MSDLNKTHPPETVISFDTIARVDEVATDVLAMDLLYSSPTFSAMVIDLVGEPAGSVIVAIRRSVAETSMGETDIEMVVDGGAGRCGILIENKIRAPLMDRQFARYRMRGEDGILKGHWDRFHVVLMSPQSYFDALDSNHSQHIDLNLSYERITKFLTNQPGNAFKRHVFLSAIADFKSGYKQTPDDAMMAFYQSYWTLASSNFPQLRMLKPNIVGKDGSWINFPPLYGHGNKVRLIHKFKAIGCELAVITRRSEQLADALAPMLDNDMIVRTAKTAAYVNIGAPPLNHLLPFDRLRDDVITSLQQLERLRVFAMREEVRKQILAVI